jgi:antitoxin component of MazEF toxin-antitoxin module
MLSGVPVTGDGISGYHDEGETTVNAFKVYTAVGGSLAVRIPNEQLEAIGIDFSTDPEDKDPPVVNVFAGDDVLTIEPLRTQEVEISMDESLHMLPEKMRQDYKAVVEDGKTPSEQAEDRGFEKPENPGVSGGVGTADPKYHIERNVEEAKRRLNDPEGEGRPEEGSERTAELVRVSRQRIREIDPAGFRTRITTALRRALPDSADTPWYDADEIGLEFDLMTAHDIGILPAVVETRPDKIGNGREDDRWMRVEETSPQPGKMNKSFRVRIPKSALTALGYNPDHADGAPIDVWAGSENGGSIALSPPESRTIVIDKPEAIDKTLSFAESNR